MEPAVQTALISSSAALALFKAQEQAKLAPRRLTKDVGKASSRNESRRTRGSLVSQRKDAPK
jgi:hypothetical protein